MPTEGKYVIYKYFAKGVLTKLNKSTKEINKSESKKAILDRKKFTRGNY